MSDHEDHIYNNANMAREQKGKAKLTVEQYLEQVSLHRSTARSDLLHDYLVNEVN